MRWTWKFRLWIVAAVAVLSVYPPSAPGFRPLSAHAQGCWDTNGINDCVAQPSQRQRTVITRNPNLPALPASKWVSIALSNSTLQYAVASGYGSLRLAEQNALVYCRKQAVDCKVVRWGQNICTGLALSNVDKKWGAYNDTDQTRTGQLAVSDCMKSGGKSCALATVHCAHEDDK